MKATLTLMALLATFHVAFCFERNAGQLHDGKGNANSNVHFIHNSKAYNVLLLSNGFSYQFQTHAPTNASKGEIGFRLQYHRIDVTFEGADANPFITHSAPRFSNTHYREEDKKFVSEVMDTITYHHVFEGVDIRFVSKESIFKYDIICANREALNRFELRFSGALGPVQVSETGELILSTSFGTVVEKIPMSFLEKGDTHKTVGILPTVSADGALVRFIMDAPWPEGHQLVIDPLPHLLWSSYVGGEDVDELRQVDTDSDGNIYLSGFTTSLNTIATAGAHQGTLVGFQNCFLQKYSPQGQKLFGTYFGGQSADRCYGMTRDTANGHIYMSGSSFSAGIATAGTHQQALASPDDGILVKFASDGTRLWSTYFGGNGHDFIAELSVDILGDLVMTGHTKSTNGISTDLTLLPGNENAFIAKFSADGYQLWGTYLGGTFDEGWGIGTDASGNIFVSGETSSTSGISTLGSHQPTLGGALDAFLVKYTTNGQGLWGTYFGGTGSERSTALTVCADGTVVITGNTENSNGLATSSAYQTQPRNVNNCFLARFSTSGQRIWSTYVGGEGVEYLTTIKETPSGGLLIGGRSESYFQVTTSGAHQTQPAGEYDALLMRFSPTGQLEWGTLFGGPTTDFVNDLAYDAQSGQIIIAGMTTSTAGVTSSNVQLQNYQGGLYDGFLARFCIPPSPSIIAPMGTTLCGAGPLPLHIDENDLSVQWNNGSTGAQLAYAPPTTGAFSVFADVVDAHGCPGKSDTLTVMAFDAFAPQFEIVMEPVDGLCVGTEAQLSLSETFAEQEWWNGSTAATTTFTGVTPSEQWLHVTVFNADGCPAADSIYVQTQLCTAINPVEGAANITFNPNPSTGTIVMHWPSHAGEMMLVTINSLDGRVVFRTQQAIGLPIYLPLAAGGYVLGCQSMENTEQFFAPLLLTTH